MTPWCFQHQERCGEGERLRVPFIMGGTLFFCVGGGLCTPD